MRKVPARSSAEVEAAGFDSTIYGAIVAAGGPSAVARHFGISKQRVRSWYTGDARMTDEQAEGLASLTRGNYSAATLMRSILRQKARRHLDIAERLIEAADATAEVAEGVA